MYLYRKCLLLGASSLLGMAIQAPAYAQDSGPAAGAANNADASGDIIVTAQKRAESINDVGMSITAVSGDNLLKRGVTDASQLTKVVAGFNYNETARADPVRRNAGDLRRGVQLPLLSIQGHPPAGRMRSS